MLSSEKATEPNFEEADLLARSNKKIKVDMGKQQMEETSYKGADGERRSGFSYKYYLMGSSYLDNLKEGRGIYG